jgi:hypothetical protein
MGLIKRILSRKVFSGQPFFHNQLRIESAEAIHIHWRDIRILATPRQFTELIFGMENARNAWDGKLSEQDIALSNNTLPEDTLFFNEGVIEEQENGCIHFHYQDMRIEMTPERFLMMARLFEQAKKAYNNEHEVMILMDLINPYDGGHFPTESEWRKYDSDDYDRHMDGIAKVVDGIKKGKRIRPIAVKAQDGRYQRYDGFKRYMACKQLGWANIPCYVVGDDVTPGCQDGQPWFLED